VAGIFEMTDESPLVLQIAQAIEGPWDLNGYSTERLAELRQIRWEMLSSHQQAVRRTEARSVIKELGLA
jgi:hypothetical protein